MTFRVQLLTHARVQVSEILNWMAKRSPEGALHWLDEFEKTLLKLEADPQRFPLAEESSRVSHEIRECSFQTPSGNRYRLLFAIVIDEVRILAVRAPGQNFVTSSELS